MSDSAKNLNQEFVDLIRSSMPAKTNLVKVIEAELRGGKEGIYRRIRGDVPFTFNEVVALCLKFGISLDRFLGISHNQTAVFDLNLMDSTNPLEDYQSMIHVDVEMLKEFNKNPDSKIYLAYNILPFLFFNSCETLWRFSLYRMVHQLENEKRLPVFSEMKFNNKLLIARDQLFESYKRIPKSCYILDRKIFSSLAKEIHYFYQLGMISDEDVHTLKMEMLNLLDLLETIMVSGKYPNGNEMQIYLSNVDLEVSYCCYTSPKLNFNHLRIYRVAVLNSSSTNITELQREYVESLKRFSTLVTVSGELERQMFLRSQRQLVESI